MCSELGNITQSLISGLNDGTVTLTHKIRKKILNWVGLSSILIHSSFSWTLLHTHRHMEPVHFFFFFLGGGAHVTFYACFARITNPCPNPCASHENLAQTGKKKKKKKWYKTSKTKTKQNQNIWYKNELEALKKLHFKSIKCFKGSEIIQVTRFTRFTMYFFPIQSEIFW